MLIYEWCIAICVATQMRPPRRSLNEGGGAPPVPVLDVDKIARLSRRRQWLGATGPESCADRAEPPSIAASLQPSSRGGSQSGQYGWQPDVSLVCTAERGNSMLVVGHSEHPCPHSLPSRTRDVNLVQSVCKANDCMPVSRSPVLSPPSGLPSCPSFCPGLRWRTSWWH